MTDLVANPIAKPLIVGSQEQIPKAKSLNSCLASYILIFLQ